MLQLFMRALAVSLALPSLIYAVSLPDAHDHAHEPTHTVSKRVLPDKWYHDEDHPVYALFRRGDGDVQYADVGSPEWSAPYPTSSPDPNNLPQEWVDALNAAVSAGKIPDIPQSTSINEASPTYPDGTDPESPEVCSGTYKCRNSADIWDAPDGQIGAGFDDGPTDASPPLYDFLKSNNIPVTHFMIGSNILYYPDTFLRAFQELQSDLAVHTWTHPYMTTLSNLQVLGELGWTMQLIHNSTGGKLPRYWRPPYGDGDERVRSIALEVFGMTTIYWNQDTEDWSLTTGGTTMQKVNESMTEWLTGSKSPGLIILEHELSDQSVQAFMDAYPVMKQNGWDLVSAAQLNGSHWWQDRDGSQGIVVPSGSASSSSSAPSSSGAPSGGSNHGSSSSSRSSSAGAPGSTSSGSSQESQDSSSSSASRTTPAVALVGGLIAGAVAMAL